MPHGLREFDVVTCVKVDKFEVHGIQVDSISSTLIERIVLK